MFRYHPSLYLPPSLTASMALTFVYLIPYVILSMLLLSSLRLFSPTLRQLSLEELCRGLLYELTTISLWGGLGRQGSRGLQLAMAVYFLVVNTSYVTWLYFDYCSRLQAGEGFTMWQNLLLGNAFPTYCISVTACGIVAYLLALVQIFVV